MRPDKLAIGVFSRIVPAALLFALAPFGLLAVSSPPVLNLPPTSDQVTGVPVFTTSQSTYLSVTLSNVPSGFQVTNGVYLAWCLDSFGTLQTSTYTLYNSYGGFDGDPNPPVPPLDNLNGQTAWNEVNWLINNPMGNAKDVPTATATDIQHAIWDLLDPYYAAFFPVSSQDANVQQLYSDAQAFGANFIPGPGQIVAVVLYADGIQQSTVQNIQDIFIEVTVPQTTPPPPPPDVYEVNYFRNMNMGGPDDIVDIVDPGTNGSGNLCAMIYVITTDEELNECCGCLITPDQLIELGVQANLTANPGNGQTAHNGAIKIIKSVPTNPAATGNAQCDPGAPVPTPTLEAWLTHVTTITGLPTTTEVPFLSAPLSTSEQHILATTCAFLEAHNSGPGVCTCPATLPQ